LLEVNLSHPQVKEDQELPPQTTKLWLNSKKWSILSNKEEQLEKNHKVKSLFQQKRLVKSDFF
jgi:hypothetical protein